ncbi:MAG TPA: ABC transporter ATP-binding protein [Eoetvoesiella sp.]|uniref:ABC transporter ATP-binding protein n=1 Tax=Eoetvoesiella sp. TaxID=1966355 RepID=UPI002C6B15EA|nr:ABC transporter ATP-binding protein [Eoetvoesiella sp.]HWK61300.1 ABC transporter ATP-binding protein [Eoetvoesiella sp.]
MIRFEHVSLSARRASGQVDLLRDISFTVPQGRILGLVGESGAGKSMVGRLIAGLLPEGFRITQGHIFLGDTELTGMPPAQRAALLGRKLVFIPQEPLTALNPLMTIGESFAEQLEIIGMARPRRHAEMLRRLEEMELPQPAEILQRYPHQLSGGQCQRVLIAMAFAAEPALIVADEPTTALDVVTQANVMRILARRQKANGTSIILITHDLVMASHVCDEMVVLYAGEVVESGDARTILAQPLHPYTQSLSGSTPKLAGEAKRLPTLEGFMPGLGDLAVIAGCRFQERCGIGDARCGQRRIELQQMDGGRAVRCLKVGVPLGDAAGSVAADTQGHGEQRAGQADDSPLLRVRNLSLTYRSSGGLFSWGSRANKALDDVSFEVYRGECVGIVGESGSGKSSIARSIVGMHGECEGAIDVDGISVIGARGEALEQLRRTVQIIFQDPHSALNPRRSVFRLLTQGFEALPPRARHEMAAQLEGKVAELMGDIRLPPSMLGRYPSEMSGGQKQRVNIGRGVFLAPKLLVADEIVSGLDMSVQAQILNLLKELAARYGIAVVLISHDLAVVRYLCQRVVVMYEGRAVEQGPVDEVFLRPRHEYTRRLLAAVPSGDPGKPWPVAV